MKQFRGGLAAAIAASLFVVPTMADARVGNAPGNDNFASAIALNGSSGTITGTNVEATKETGEPSLAGNTGGASVWFSWTAPTSGKATVTTAGSSFDTLLGVFTGSSVSALTLVKDSDDVSGTDKTSAVSIDVVGGTTYRIAVDGYNGTTSGQATGSVQLNWSIAQAPAAPANDNFASAQTVSGASGTTGGTNVSATKETGEPNLAGNTGGASVWYVWTAPSTGTASVTTSGSSFDTLLGVFTGSSVSALTLVKDSDDVSSTDKTSAVSFAVTAGTTYRIAVDGYRGTTSGQATGSVTLNWSLAAAPGAPANDNFANARALTGASGTTTGTNVSATKETGEPTLTGNTGGASVWFSWTAPATGNATVTTSGSAFDTMLGVFTGSSVSGLTLVKDSDDVSSTDKTSAVTFPVTAGTVYRIAVDGFRGATSGLSTGSYTLNWTSTAAPSAPANNNFASAQALSGATGTVNGTNVSATKETGEPNIAGNSGGASVWYAWTAPSAGTVTVTTAGSSFDTLLGVFTGTSVPALTLVKDSDDVSSTDKTSSVTFAATAGTQYRIVVDGYHGTYSGQATGSITLNWSLAAPPAAPANDAFARATAISGASGATTGTNVGATKETGEPGLAGNTGGASVWYSWTAPSTGSATITTAGSAFDTMLGVFTGSSVSALTLLKDNDDVSGTDRTSSVTFNATSGTTYRIMVDGYKGPSSGQASGAVSLHWTLTAAPAGPANDNFASAQAISGASGSVTGNNTTATKETGEPAITGNSGGASVWYRYQAATTGAATINTAGSSFDTMLAVYTGSAVGALTRIAENDDVSATDRTSSVTFNAVAGTTYMITVDGFRGPNSGQASGALTLAWSLNAAPPPPPPGGDPQVIAAGDVHANCGTSQAPATASIIQSSPNASVLMLGDATDAGLAADFNNCYQPTWGQFKARTHPVPGNHDYDQPNATPYYSYFGSLASDPGKGYYSFDIGRWHVVALNSNCSVINCPAETTWLQQDLAANRATCTLAYFHQPLFTSAPAPGGNDGPVNPFWTALYNANADVILNAHARNYERFAPQNASGVADSARGIREFVSGAAGGALDTTNKHAANSQVVQGTTFGVLMLTLHSTSYDWKFLPVAGSTWTDSGTGNCH